MNKSDTEFLNKSVNELEKASNQIKKILDSYSKYGKNLKVLYLEDEETDAEFVKEILDVDFIDIDIADSYLSAVKKYNETNYDAYIVDLLLKDGYSGFDFIDFVNLNSKKPIVVLTGVKSQELIDKCKDSNINNIYLKSELINLIRYSTDFIKSLIE
jgi:CheY-like chemotaxis protein